MDGMRNSLMGPLGWSGLEGCHWATYFCPWCWTQVGSSSMIEHPLLVQWVIEQVPPCSSQCSTCVWMYVCMYDVHIICVCMYVCTYILYICIYVCMYICTYIHMYVCMYVCTYVCVCVYIYIYIYISCL